MRTLSSINLEQLWRDVNSKRISTTMSLVNDDAEGDLRELIQRTPLNTLSEPEKWKEYTFYHKDGRNTLVSIQKKEDWYFVFDDKNHALDSTTYSLSELTLESKLILMDLLQNL